MKLFVAAAAISAVGLSGCTFFGAGNTHSSMIGSTTAVFGTSEIVSVETRFGAQIVTGVFCRLQNSEGVWQVTTPDTITIHRAYDDLNIKCQKDGLPPVVMTIPSDSEYRAGYSLPWDVANGAAYRYPSLISVQMSGIAPVAAIPAYRGEE